ncbi:hypothetical protein [Streptomyces sp. NBC_00259]|uniref:hypothetical protein n=1 Tax=Streptomyces sp. NBC_00259 TaxID=2903643 RepID=UPI002E2D78BA|nr:hypothetical protein [Streptomyces sp. NBC_00259]
MPQHNHAPARVCPSCDGFASAAVTLGGRDRGGQRRTITAHCRTCQGTGTIPPLRQLPDAAVIAR